MTKKSVYRAINVADIRIIAWQPLPLQYSTYSYDLDTIILSHDHSVYKLTSAQFDNRTIYCKNVWVTSTIFWSSQLHACCVRDTLQNFKRMLPIWIKAWEASPPVRIFLQKADTAYWLHSWHYYHNHAAKALLQGQMCRIKETPTPSEML